MKENEGREMTRRGFLRLACACTASAVLLQGCGSSSGSASCPSCAGKGKLRCVSCNGYGTIGDGSMRCPVCKGSGTQVCTMCNGSGRAPARRA